MCPGWLRPTIQLTSQDPENSYGQTVTISKSVYGWKINQSEETEALKQILLSCESQEREPVYSQTAASHDANDYGNTYAEINLTAQHMFFYKEGKLVVESDFVSGNESRGWSTPAGVYPLTYKQRNATLKGENYATPVSYWMPFNGGVGFHDATLEKQISAEQFISTMVPTDVSICLMRRQKHSIIISVQVIML